MAKTTPGQRRDRTSTRARGEIKMRRNETSEIKTASNGNLYADIIGYYPVVHNFRLLFHGTFYSKMRTEGRKFPLTVLLSNRIDLEILMSSCFVLRKYFDMHI